MSGQNFFTWLGKEISELGQTISKLGEGEKAKLKSSLPTNQPRSIGSQFARQANGEPPALAKPKPSAPQPQQTQVVSDEMKKELKKYNVDLDSTTIVNGKMSPKIGASVNSKTLTGKAATFALANGNYYAGLTILCEGVKEKAFYFDPASGGKYGTLINTHPGITLRFQTESEMRKMFGQTKLAPMTESLIRNIQAKRLTPEMRQLTLDIPDYNRMFNVIANKYSSDADKFVKERLSQHPLSKRLLQQGMTKDQVLNQIKSDLPVSSYAVLQHLSYKYGPRMRNYFGKLVDGTISAALDLPNQERHLLNTAQHIVYKYMSEGGKWHVDTRVMNYHRMFYTAGHKFTPEINLKLASNTPLTEAESKVVSNVIRNAGLSVSVKNGRVNFPEITNQRTAATDFGTPPELDTKAIDKGVAKVTTVIHEVRVLNGEYQKPQSKMNTESLKPKAAPKRQATAYNCISSACMGGD